MFDVFTLVDSPRRVQSASAPPKLRDVTLRNLQIEL